MNKARTNFAFDLFLYHYKHEALSCPHEQNLASETNLSTRDTFPFIPSKNASIY